MLFPNKLFKSSHITIKIPQSVNLKTTKNLDFYYLYSLLPFDMLKSCFSNHSRGTHQSERFSIRGSYLQFSYLLTLTLIQRQLQLKQTQLSEVLRLRVFIAEDLSRYISCDSELGHFILKFKLHNAVEVFLIDYGNFRNLLHYRFCVKTDGYKSWNFSFRKLL